MELGCFSVSLSVKDLQKSKAFYEKIGFETFAGDESHNFLIMKNGSINIGLFQGVFEENILTFIPGWDQDAKNLDSFSDVRALHEICKSSNLEIAQESITGDTGPSSFSVVDPDGNTRHLFNDEMFALVKPGAMLVNTSRGGVIDEQALIKALHNGQIKSAFLDVFEREPLPQDSPLWSMDNVIVTPHTTDNVYDFEKMYLKLFCENISNWRSGKELVNLVDL